MVTARMPWAITIETGKLRSGGTASSHGLAWSLEEPGVRVCQPRHPCPRRDRVRPVFVWHWAGQGGAPPPSPVDADPAEKHRWG